MQKRWLGVLAALVTWAILAFAPHAWADVAIPALKGRVTDLTGTLTPDQTSALEQRLKAFEAQKGTQIVVLMLPSTKPEAIEQFSIRLAEAWKIGRKGTDDGLILVVAKEDRRLRIEVGYGLEGAIPDAVANRVISETITPRFKAGDFSGGITAGVEQLIKLVEGEKLPPPAAGQGTSSPRSSGAADPLEYAVPAFFLVLIGGALFRSMFGRFPGALATGLVAGGVAWFLFSIGVATLFALLAFIFTVINTGRGSGLGGFSTGSSGGSWSSGSGGGGFSGGGGSFGGGGSSGSW